MTQRNCDGCARGLPAVDGLHRGTEPWDLQACTAARYAPTECPKCGGPILDLRGAAFNPDALAAQGSCYAWDRQSYTCVQGYRRPLPLDERLPKEELWPTKL